MHAHSAAQAILEPEAGRASMAPVRTNPVDITNMAATVATASLANPAMPSAGVMTRVSTRAAITISPTNSTRRRLWTKSPSATTVTARVIHIGPVMTQGLQHRTRLDHRASGRELLPSAGAR